MFSHCLSKHLSLRAKTATVTKRSGLQTLLLFLPARSQGQIDASDPAFLQQMNSHPESNKERERDRTLFLVCTNRAVHSRVGVSGVCRGRESEMDVPIGALSGPESEVCVRVCVCVYAEGVLLQLCGSQTFSSRPHTTLVQFYTYNREKIPTIR